MNPTKTGLHNFEDRKNKNEIKGITKDFNRENDSTAPLPCTLSASKIQSCHGQCRTSYQKIVLGMTMFTCTDAENQEI